MDAINSRRSIHRFSDREIPHDITYKIIRNGTKVPLSKNRQPWEFMVVQGQAKEETLRVSRVGIQKEKSDRATLPENSRHLRGAEYTAQIMEQVPMVIFVLNLPGKELFAPLGDGDKIYELCSVQLIGAVIGNMLLEATDLGVRSLWIRDILFAYEELYKWMDCGGELVAIVALSYSEESPSPRSQKRFEDVVVWKR